MNKTEKQTYLTHSKLRIFQGRIKSAKTIIKCGLKEMRNPYASLSFGKDSIVMVHLLWSLFPTLPVMYVNCGKYDEWPDTPRVKREFLALFPGANFIELTGPSIIKFYRQAGLYIQDEELSQEAKKAQREYGESLALILDAEAHKRGFDGSFIGVRKEESDNRERLFNMRGPLYYAKTRKLWACHPLAFWTGRDIWAYTVKNSLPYNELYDLDPQGREVARNGAMFGTRSVRYGRLIFLQRMYPGWFNRFAAEFPKARNYV